MYAYTANSFRAISSPQDATAGEQVAGEVPQAVLRAIRSDEVRREIALRIRATDWALVADAVITPQDKAAITAYRAALRALPDHAGFPEMPWPELPRTAGVGSETGEQA